MVSVAHDMLTPVIDNGSKQLPEQGIADIAAAGLFLLCFCVRCSTLRELSIAEEAFVSVSDKLLSAFPRGINGSSRADIAPEIALPAMPVTYYANGEEVSGLCLAAVLAGLVSIPVALSSAVALYCFHWQNYHLSQTSLGSAGAGLLFISSFIRSIVLPCLFSSPTLLL